MIDASAQSSTWKFLDAEISLVDMRPSGDIASGSGDWCIPEIRINNTGVSYIDGDDYTVGGVYTADKGETIRYPALYWELGFNSLLCLGSHIDVPPRFAKTWTFCYRLPANVMPVCVEVYSGFDKVAQILQFKN